MERIINNSSVGLRYTPSSTSSRPSSIRVVYTPSKSKKTNIMNITSEDSLNNELQKHDTNDLINNEENGRMTSSTNVKFWPFGIVNSVSTPSVVIPAHLYSCGIPSW